MISFGEDTGNVVQPREAWGPYVGRSHADLRMNIYRTPFGVRESQPAHVRDWGRLGITPNGRLISFSGATDDALTALDKIGTRGAAVLGAGAGLVLSTNRMLGAAVGAGLGYLAGRYLASIIKATVAVQKVATIAEKVG
jgi:hypothetical protein